MIQERKKKAISSKIAFLEMNDNLLDRVRGLGRDTDIRYKILVIRYGFLEIGLY